MISKMFSKAILTDETSPVITTAPENLSTKPISTSAAFVAISTTIIDASLGVIVKIPPASSPDCAIPSF